MKTKHVIIGLVLVLIVAGVAYYYWKKNKTTATKTDVKGAVTPPIIATETAQTARVASLPKNSLNTDVISPVAVQVAGENCYEVFNVDSAGVQWPYNPRKFNCGGVMKNVHGQVI